MSEIQRALALNNVQTYQNWELGYNRPDPTYFGPLSRFLGLDVGELYSPGRSKADPEEQIIKAKAVRPLLHAIRRNLEALELMVGPEES